MANDTLIGLGIVAVCALIGCWILFQSRNAVRDRVLAIYVLGIFVVFFWAAFEQAGNVLNLWADKSTDRYLIRSWPTPDKYPEAAGTPEKEEDTGVQAQEFSLTGAL